MAIHQQLTLFFLGLTFICASASPSQSHAQLLRRRGLNARMDRCCQASCCLPETTPGSCPDRCKYHWDEDWGYVIDKGCSGLNCACPIPTGVPTPIEGTIGDAQCVEDILGSEMLFQIQEEEMVVAGEAEIAVEASPPVRYSLKGAHFHSQYTFLRDNNAVWQITFSKRNKAKSCKEEKKDGGLLDALSVTINPLSEEDPQYNTPCTFKVKRNGTTVKWHGHWKVTVRHGTAAKKLE